MNHSGHPVIFRGRPTGGTRLHQVTALPTEHEGNGRFHSVPLVQDASADPRVMQIYARSIKLLDLMVWSLPASLGQDLERMSARAETGTLHEPRTNEGEDGAR